MPKFTTPKIAAMVSVLLALAALGGPAAGTDANSGQGADHANRTLRVSLVRHGESEANLAGIADTDLPGAPLTVTGIQQAETFADSLTDQRRPADAVYASAMYRAQQTAAPLAEALDRNVWILPNVHEIDLGDLPAGPSRRSADAEYRSPRNGSPATSKPSSRAANGHTL
jgi:hypothetical protein